MSNIESIYQLKAFQIANFEEQSRTSRAMISEDREVACEVERKVRIRKFRPNRFEKFTKVSFNERKLIQERPMNTITDSNFRDDGYLSLAESQEKTSNTLRPMHSWPLQRKITGRELKEYGEKLDSGSSSLLDTKTIHRNSHESVPCYPERVSIEVAMKDSRSDLDAYYVDKCIDYCTCMFCVKSACYICKDSEDDTGDPDYNPCSCSPPSKLCMCRWGLLGLLACIIPCLFCYPVARACVSRQDQCRKKKKYKNSVSEKRCRVKVSKSKTWSGNS